MCRVLCVTSRALAGANFREKLQKIAQSGVSGMILREKDMDETAYRELAAWAKAVCRAAGVSLTVHTFADTARELDIRSLHLPLDGLLLMTEREKLDFDVLGTSVHSVQEAVSAQKAGASYIIAGHIFFTGCKKGLLPRGLSFLREVCREVTIPVYAIGGITEENASACIREGASGVCLMSSLMQSPAPEEIMGKITIFH